MVEVKLSFPNNSDSAVYVYRDGIAIYQMERDFLFGSEKIARIFQQDKFLLKVSDFFLNIKIHEQSLEPRITLKSNTLFSANFRAAQDNIRVTQYHLIWLIDKRKYVKILWNSEKIGTVCIDKILDPNGLHFTMHLDTDDEHKINYSILCFLMTQLTTNI